MQGSVAEKWDVLKGALCGEAKAVLGYEDRKSEAALRSSIDERNRLYALWLSTGRLRDRKKHAEAHRCVRQQVRAAKDAWFLQRQREGDIIIIMEAGWCGAASGTSSEVGEVWSWCSQQAAVRDEDGSVCSLRLSSRGGDSISPRFSTYRVSSVQKKGQTEINEA